MIAKTVFLSLMAVLMASQALAVNYGKDDLTYKYYIDINSQSKGMLTVTKEQDSFHSEYFGVTAEDRLPFYSRKKTGSYRDGVYATSLSFDGDAFDIYYEKDKAPKGVDEYLRGDSSQKAIVWNPATGRPRLSFDRIPAVTLENILLGMLNRSFKVGEYYYLLEGAKNSGLRLYCEKEESIPAEAGSDVKCGSASYLFKRTNVPGEPDVPLFRVIVNKDNVPLKVVSNSGRWGLRLGGISQGVQTVEFDQNSALVIMAQKDFRSKALRAAGDKADFSDFDFKITSQNGDIVNYGFQFKASGFVFEDDRGLAVRLLAERIHGYRASVDSGLAKSLEDDSRGYYVEVENDDVCDEYRKSYSSGKVDKRCATVIKERSLTVPQEELNKFAARAYGCDPGSLKYKGAWMGSDKLICTSAGSEQKIELQAALEAYLAARADIKGATIKDYEAYEAFGDRYDFKLVLEQQEAVNSRELDYEAGKLLTAKVTGKPYASKVQGLKDVQFQKIGDGYRLSVDRQAVARYRSDLSVAACKQMAAGLGAKSPMATDLPGDACQVSGEISRNVREAVKALETSIYGEYIDLKLMGKTIDKNRNIWSFDYLSGFEGFKDACY
jgi:hypothetical protein